MVAFVPAPAVTAGSHRATLPSNRAATSTTTHFLSPKPLAVSSSSFTPSFASQPNRTPNPISRPRFTMLLDKAARNPATSVVTESRRRQLEKIITSGPVFQSAQLVLSDVTADAGCRTDAQETCLDDWIEMGAILEDALARQANDVRVYQYYLPVYFWILRELELHRSRIEEEGSPQRPFILGFCCPQGGGKTTMTTFLETLLRSSAKNVQIASLDDFYVTNSEQRKIAQANPDNRLMQYRGMPGTHDLQLMNSTLDRLRQGKDVSIPKYDKTAFNGRGDRAPRDAWKHIAETTDVVLLEGWCLGFEPVSKDHIIHPDLQVVNNALNDFMTMYTRIDGMFIIEISNMDWVFDWRLQAERGTRAAGKPGLSDEQVVDFVSRFMPAYKQYSPLLYNRETPLFPKHELHIEIDNQRRPVHRKNRK